MTDVENKESQKTVVAFISGLLIGGLLVWVFSSSPEKAVAPESTNDTIENLNTENTDTSVNDKKTEATTVVVGEGSIIIKNQPAGTTVVIDSMNVPTVHGWVVVREFMNGVSGNILGAARYSIEEQLIPKQVELIRGTTKGGSYQVVFFTNSGDTKFDLGEDVLIEGIATTFEAQ